MGEDWIVKRAEFSEKTKDIIYTRDNGLCQLCGQPVTRQVAEFDHVKECWEFEAGEADNSAANGQTACPPCHSVKSSEKRKSLVKVRRLHKKANGKARPPRKKIMNNGGKIPSRPMPKVKTKIPNRKWDYKNDRTTK